VHEVTGADFRGYKRTTVVRRAARRMALRHTGTMAEYALAVRNDPEEARAFARDMLIHVTAFFRDPEEFVALREHAIDLLVGRKREGEPIRVWVPGCSTGEEAYAVAICVVEALQAVGRSAAVKVFATDLAPEAIGVARAGRYADAALADVDPLRIARFFERVEGGYRIGKAIRDLVVFVKHDLTRDAPFARLDLVSCRNVLIYFEAELQRRVVPMLHYCLGRQGYLFVGKSEALTGFRSLFEPVDAEHRVFVKVGESSRLTYPAPANREAEARMDDVGRVDRRPPLSDALRQADHLQLSRYAPPGAIVNERLEVVQFRGRTGAYFEPAPGQPQNNLLRMAREGLAAHLHDALERAKVERASVRKAGLRLEEGGAARVVDLEVTPLAAPSNATERYFLVAFEETPRGTRPEWAASPTEAESVAGAAPTEADRLRGELQATKDSCSRSSPSTRRTPTISPRRTRSSSPPTRSCRAPTRSCRARRRSCRAPTRSSAPSTTSSAAATRSSTTWRTT
jgi:two-component system CheB/CheR fusion protein